jgi:hypothetical protein
MSTGTVTMVKTGKLSIASDNTTAAVDELPSGEELEQPRFVDAHNQSPLYYKSDNAIFTNTAHFNSMNRGHKAGTGAPDWDAILRDVQEKKLNIWDSPKLKRLLSEPIGSPIDLTKEEAEEIVRLAAGRRPDLPKGMDVVREVREIFGHSIMDKIKKADNK